MSRTAGAPARGSWITAFTLFLFGGSVATGAAAHAIGGPGGTFRWVQGSLLVGVLALASHLIIRVQYKDQVEALDLFEAVLAPTIVVFPGLAAVGLAAIAKTTVNLLHRNAGMKARFNVAQWAAATGCGALVYAALRSGEGLTARNVVALVLALVAVAIVNHGAFTVVLSLANGQRIREVLDQLRPVIPIGWLGGSAVNIAFGVLFVSAYLRSSVAVVVMVVPLVVLHWGSRGFATARTDRMRLAGLQAATHALAGPVDPRDAIPPFLAEVRRCFEADAVDLLTVSQGTAVRYRVAAGQPDWCGSDDGLSTAARLLSAAVRGCVVVTAKDDRMGLLAAESWRMAAIAPLRYGDDAMGALCVYNRGGVEGFEDGERVVLEALAVEMAGALEKAELLADMLEERRQLADIVGNTSDGIVTLDETGVVTSWNSGMEGITGYGATTMLGRVPGALLYPRDAHGAPVALDRWADRVAHLPDSLEIVTADGQSRWLSCSYTGLEPRDGRGAQLVLMARDVTKVHELDKLKDDFVAIVSHELRTPLAPMKGWAIALMNRGEDLSPEQRREGARSILRQADRLEQLILNILEDSRIEQEKGIGAVDEVVDVTASVCKVLDEFAVLAPDRSIVCHGAGQPARAVGRSVRIEQVLTNLIGNAVKYSPKTEPIDVTIHRGPGVISISVRDRGPGIPPESRERVFQRFERLSDSPAQTGTGLGLYISRHLATTMGAELDVEPASDGGSVFTLRLRAVRALAAVG